MGAILNKPWGGAYMDNVKILDVNGEWKFKSGSTTVLSSWNMLYKITGKSGQCILWGEIAPKNSSDYGGQNILDLSFLGNIDSFDTTFSNGGSWLQVTNKGNMLVCEYDELSVYGSEKGFQSLLYGGDSDLIEFSLK